MKVGWIGLGHIGAPMAERVRAAGHALQVWARRPQGTAALVAAGAQATVDVESLARDNDVVCTCVAGPDDVLGLQRQLMPAARPGTLFIDCSTAAPRTGQASAALAAAHGMRALDAPVTGGVAGAQRGTLTSFVGGDAEALALARPVLDSFSARVLHSGGAGAGYRVKLINQTLMAGALMGLADGARLARAAGIDGAWLKDALGSGSGASNLFNAYLTRMLDDDGTVGFSLALLLKDLRLARDEGLAQQLPLPLLDAAIAAVEMASARFGADAGLQTLGAA